MTGLCWPYQANIELDGGITREQPTLTNMAFVRLARDIAYVLTFVLSLLFSPPCRMGQSKAAAHSFGGSMCGVDRYSTGPLGLTASKKTPVIKCEFDTHAHAQSKCHILTLHISLTGTWRVLDIWKSNTVVIVWEAVRAQHEVRDRQTVHKARRAFPWSKHFQTKIFR